MPKVFLVGLILLGLGISSRAGESSPRDHVIIKPNAIWIPVGTIVLARKDREYCAIKIRDAKRGKNEGDWNAAYESYYQNDMSGTFANKHAKYRKDELYSRQPGGFGHLTAINRSREVILCGGISVQWSGGNWIYPYVYYDKDYTRIALAPTKWKDIAEVNFLDPRLVWYGYDEKRPTSEIPLEKLW
jgi:hypothetical protein